MKKFLAFLLAMMVAMSMFTFAFAEEGEGENNTGSSTPTLTDETHFDIAKVYYLCNGGTNSPAARFEFKVTAVGVTDSEKYTLDNMPVPSYKDTNSTAAADANFFIEYDDADVIGVYSAADPGKGYKKVAPFVLPPYEAPGIFTYKVTEVTPNIAGVKLMTYDENGVLVEAAGDAGFLRMIVTVGYDEASKLCRVVNVYYENEDGQKINVPSDATSGIVNMYSAGSLKITKTVSGNMGDTSKKFGVNVTFAGANVSSEITYEIKNGDGSPVTNGTGTITPAEWNTDGKVSKKIELSHGQYVVFNNIPYGVKYSVVEDDYTGEGEGYDAPVYTLNEVLTRAKSSTDPNNGATPVSSEEMNQASESVEIKNNKGITINTGLVLDTLPYIILLAVAVVGVVAMLMKKRASRED